MNNQALSAIIWAVVALVAVYFCVVVYQLQKVANLWRRAFLSQVPVTYFELVGMSLRGVPIEVVVNARIKAKHAGLKVDGFEGCTVERLESHFLAGGDIDRVIKALIVAKSRGIDLDFATAALTDLAEQD